MPKELKIILKRAIYSPQKRPTHSLAALRAAHLIPNYNATEAEEPRFVDLFGVCLLLDWDRCMDGQALE